MNTSPNAVVGSRDLTFGMLVVFIWGVNFAVMKYCISGIPPMLLGALRFILVALPAVLFVPAPKVPLRFYVIYGMTLSFAQPALLYTAIKMNMSSGLASLVLQSQAMFTMLFAFLWLKEPCHKHQLIGLVLGVVGMTLIGSTYGSSMPLVGFLLTAGAAAMWASGNIVTRVLINYGSIDQLGFVAWSSLVPVVPFIVLSYFMEGPSSIAESLSNLSVSSTSALLYLSWVATLLGYAIWSKLLAKYPANRITPLSLLVPFIGLAVGWLVFDETFLSMHVLGGLILMTGLIINLFGTHLFLRRLSAFRFSFKKSRIENEGL